MLHQHIYPNLPCKSSVTGIIPLLELQMQLYIKWLIDYWDWLAVESFKSILFPSILKYIYIFHTLFTLYGTRITLQWSAFYLRSPFQHSTWFFSFSSSFFNFFPLCANQVKASPRLPLLNGWVSLNIQCLFYYLATGICFKGTFSCACWLVLGTSMLGSSSTW